MKQMTVNELFKMVASEMLNGNGDKLIYIPDDNEGNAYHGMYYGFSEITEDVKSGAIPFNSYFFDGNGTPDNSIILG